MMANCVENLKVMAEPESVDVKALVSGGNHVRVRHNDAEKR